MPSFTRAASLRSNLLVHLSASLSFFRLPGWFMCAQRAAKSRAWKGEDTAEEDEEEERKDLAPARPVRLKLPSSSPDMSAKSPRGNQVEETPAGEAGGLQVKSKVRGEEGGGG
eukprot:181280-Hanusia_phi.AAC.5